MRHTTAARLPARRLALRLLCAGTVLLAAALAVKPAQAGMAVLSDAELAQVNGRAAAPAADPRALPLPGVGALLNLLSPEQMKPTLLDRAAFEAALAARGMGPLPAELYAGQPVTQLSVEAAPRTLTLEAGALFIPAGLPYHGGSFGTVTITNFDARGTTLWVWHR